MTPPEHGSSSPRWSAAVTRLRAWLCTRALYGIFLFLCLSVVLSREASKGGSYDFVLALLTGLQTLAYGLLIWNRRNQRAAGGLSERSLLLVFIAQVARSASFAWGPGYVPEDSSVYVYLTFEISGAVVLVYGLFKMAMMRPTSHEPKYSEKGCIIIKHQNKENKTTAVILLGALVLAVFTKADAHSHYLADITWMFAFWVDAFALLPQVQHLDESMRVDESLVRFVTVHVFTGIGLGIFWMQAFLADPLLDSPTLDIDRRHELLPNFVGIFFACIIRICMCIAYGSALARTSKTCVDLSAQKKDQISVMPWMKLDFVWLDI